MKKSNKKKGTAFPPHPKGWGIHAGSFMKHQAGYYPDKNCARDASKPLKIKLEGAKFSLDWRDIDSEEFRAYIERIIIEASDNGSICLSCGGKIVRKNK